MTENKEERMKEPMDEQSQPEEPMRRTEPWDGNRTVSGGLAAIGNLRSGYNPNMIPRLECKDNACEVHGEKAKATARRQARKYALAQLDRDRAALAGAVIQALANAGGYEHQPAALAEEAVLAVDMLMQRLGTRERMLREAPGMIATGGGICSTECAAMEAEKERWHLERQRQWAKEWATPRAPTAQPDPGAGNQGDKRA